MLDKITLDNDNPLFQKVIEENIRLGRIMLPTPQQNAVFKLLGKGVLISNETNKKQHVTGYIIHYGGSKGSGKTALGVGSCVWACKKFPGITTMIVRKTQKQADIQIIQKELLNCRPPEVFGYKWYKQDRLAVFYNKDHKLDELDCSRIIFQPIAREADTDKVYGNEFQYLYIDEAQFLEMEIVIKMFGSLRGNIKNWVPTTLLTGNPGGICYDFIKTYWVDPSRILDYDYENKWEKRFLDQKERFKFVYASPKDNIYLQNSYYDNINIQDSKTKAAWYGEYDDFQGKFFDEFREDKHVLRGSEQFTIPKHWERKVGFDLGEATSEDYVRHPSVFLWMAQDPETMALYVYREKTIPKFYPDTLYDVLELCKDEDITEWISDPSTHSKKPNGGNNTYAEMFQNAGIFLKKASNERVPGWQAVKAWMHWEGDNKPLLYIFGDECPFLVKTIPMMTHNTKGNVEDMNSRKLDDACDVLRYIIYNGFQYPLKEIRDTLDYNKKIRNKENTGTTFIEQWITGVFEEPTKPKYKNTIMTRDDVDAFYQKEYYEEENYNPVKRIEKHWSKYEEEN
jgi:phage terminase large subunit